MRVRRVRAGGGGVLFAEERDGALVALEPEGGCESRLPPGDGPRADVVLPGDGGASLAPVNPSKIVAIGLNYRDHVEETGMEEPKAPLIFTKFTSSLIGDGEGEPQLVTLTPEHEAAEHTAPLNPTLCPAPSEAGTVSVAPNAIPQTSAVTPDLYGDTLTVTTDVSGDSPRDIPLRLTARGSIFAISTNNINFGSVAVGATASSQFTVTNNGNAVGGLVFTPGQPSIFGLPSNAQVNATSASHATAPASDTARPVRKPGGT